MRNLIYLFALIVISECSSEKKETLTFEEKTYSLINTDVMGFKDSDFEYGIYEFLKKGRLIMEGKIFSEVVLQQGNWNYFRKDSKEYLVLEELEQLIDTFELIHNDNFQNYEYVLKSGDTMKFEQIKEDCQIESKLLLGIRWKSINDSIGYWRDEPGANLNYLFSEYQFNSDGTYRIKYKQERSGRWQFNSCNNRIILDSLSNNRDIIKLERLTQDTLIFWRRNHHREPKEIICINATEHNISATNI